MCKSLCGSFTPCSLTLHDVYSISYSVLEINHAQNTYHPFCFMKDRRARHSSACLHYSKVPAQHIQKRHPDCHHFCHFEADIIFFYPLSKIIVINLVLYNIVACYCQHMLKLSKDVLFSFKQILFVVNILQDKHRRKGTGIASKNTVCPTPLTRIISCETSAAWNKHFSKHHFYSIF